MDSKINNTPKLIESFDNCDIIEKVKSLEFDNSFVEYNNKYGDIINDKEFYALFLQIKTKLNRVLKLVNNKSLNTDKANKLLKDFNLFVFTCRCLSTYDQYKTLASLITYFTEELTITNIKIEEDANINNNLSNDIESELPLDNNKNKFYMSLIGILLYSYTMLPKINYKKSDLQFSILKLLKSKQVPISLIRQTNLYVIFTTDCLFNNDIEKGYKFAIVSEKYSIINNYINLHMENSNDLLENLMFVTRIIFEYILINNLKLANMIFINNVINHPLNNNINNNLFEILNKNCNNEDLIEFAKKNHPLTNFTTILVSIINQKVKNGIDNFNCLKEAYESYSKWLSIDNNLNVCVNSIAKLYYNKMLIAQQQNFNPLEMLTNLAF